MQAHLARANSPNGLSPRCDSAHKCKKSHKKIEWSPKIETQASGLVAGMFLRQSLHHPAAIGQIEQWDKVPRVGTVLDKALNAFGHPEQVPSHGVRCGRAA